MKYIKKSFKTDRHNFWGVPPRDPLPTAGASPLEVRCVVGPSDKSSWGVDFLRLHEVSTPRTLGSGFAVKARWDAY